MPQCRIPNNKVILVSSCQECEQVYSGGCFEDGGIGLNIEGSCFVRNVLLRTLTDALLHVGSYANISATAIGNLTIGRVVSQTHSLTADLRQDLARRITGGILQLASTYQTAVDCRDHILKATPRGRELKELYDEHLDKLYHATARDLGLLHDAATLWLTVHPYVAAMVTLTRGSDTAEAGRVSLSAEQFQECKSLIQRFRATSEDAAFHRAMDQVEREFEGYERLTAAESLAKLRAAPAAGG
jgi:hypothetical protein